MTVLLLSCIFLGIVLFRSSSNLIKNYVFEEVENSLSQLGYEFQDYITDIKNDVLVLSENPYLKQSAVDNLTSIHLEHMASEYINLLDKKEHYSQIRLIGSQLQGKELIRAERSDQLIRLVPDSLLQNKGQRDYFKKTSQLAPGEVYFSKIDLNKEFGEISEPVTPTLRAAVPLYHQDQFQGIVIINLNLSSFFIKLSKYAGQDKSLFLFTAEKDFLIHPDSSLTFGFEYGRHDLAEPLNQISTQKVPEEIYLPNIYKKPLYYFFDRWPYPGDEEELVCGLGISAGDILAPVRDWQNQSLLYIVVVLLLASILGGLFLRRQVRQFGKITRLMKFPTTSESIKELPVHRNDEIGEMAQSFEKMHQEIVASFSKIETEKLAAVAATNEKEAFIENMSHELRTPLQNIMGMTDVLSNNNPRQDQIPVLNSIRFSSQYLRSLLNDVLDYKLLKENKIQLQPDTTHLEKLIQQITSSHQYRAHLRNVEIKYHIDTYFRIHHILTDSLRLTQIINNLLSNAIKYSHKNGTVQINVNHLSENLMEFAIEDQGIGIGKEQIEWIQGRFRRGNLSDIGQTEGVGLGLSVVTQLLDLFGSELNIRSEKGKGSIFSFVINFAKDDLDRKNIDSGEFVPCYYKDIWAIDDDEQMILFYKNAFSMDSLNLTSTTQMDRWNEFIRGDSKFDLILADNRFFDVRLLESESKLTSKLQDGGLLIFTSGDRLQSGVPSLIKPFTKKQLYSHIEAFWKEQLGGKANFTSVENDYDGDRQKLLKVYQLMSKEWKDMNERLIHSLRIKNEAEYDQVFHKMTTTLKRLQLIQLNKALLRTADYIAEVSDKEINYYKLLFVQVHEQIHERLKQYST